MPYSTNADLPESVRNALPASAQSTFREIVNNALEQYDGDEEKAFATAWAGLKRTGWEKGDDGKWHRVEKKFEIVKSDEKGRCFGWASIAFTADGQQIEDLQKDMIDEVELEEAAYRFMAEFQGAGEMHRRMGVAKVIESIVFTKEKQQALGIPEGTLPIAWWLGLEVTDPEVKKAVRERKLTAFSIGGSARREEVKHGE